MSGVADCSCKAGKDVSKRDVIANDGRSTNDHWYRASSRDGAERVQAYQASNPGLFLIVTGTQKST